MSRETVDTMNPIGNAPATLDSINPIDPASNPGRAWTNIEGNTAAFNSLVQSASNEIFNPPAHLTDSALTPGGPFTPLDITAGPNQPTVDTAVRDYVGRFIDDVQSTPGLTVVKNGKAERAAFYDLGHAVRIDATSRIIFNPSGYPTTLEADEARNRLRSVVDAALSGSPRLRNYTDAQKQVYRNHYLTSFDARYPNSTEATQIRQQERLRNVDNELNDPELIGKITQSRENLAKLAVKDDERFWRFLGRRKIKKEERELRDSLNKFDTLLIEREVLTGNIDGSDADAIKARIAALKISHYSDNIKAIDRAQQLAESDPSSVHGWFTSKAIKFADWYREQSTAKKIMIGGAVAVSAVAMGFFTGPVGAGAVLAAGRIPQLNSFRGHSKRRSDKKNKRIFDNNIKYLDEGVKSLNLTEYGDISQASNILFQKQLEREFRATRRRVIGSVGMRAAVMAGTFVGGKMAAQFIEDHHLLDGVSRFFGDKWDVVVDKWHDVFGGDKVVTSSRFDPTTPGGSGSGSKLGSTMMDRAEHGLNPTSHEINEIVMKYDGSTVKYGSPDWQKLTQGLRSDHVNADDVAQIMEILPKNTVDPSTGDLMPLSGSQVKQQFGSITGSMNNQQLEAMGRFFNSDYKGMVETHGQAAVDRLFSSMDSSVDPIHDSFIDQLASENGRGAAFDIGGLQAHANMPDTGIRDAIAARISEYESLYPDGGARPTTLNVRDFLSPEQAKEYIAYNQRFTDMISSHLDTKGIPDGFIVEIASNPEKYFDDPGIAKLWLELYSDSDSSKWADIIDYIRKNPNTMYIGGGVLGALGLGALVKSRRS